MVICLFEGIGVDLMLLDGWFWLWFLFLIFTCLCAGAVLMVNNRCRADRIHEKKRLKLERDIMAKKMRLSYAQKSWMLSAHILFIVAWFGGILCMFGLLITSLSANHNNELYVIYMNINLLDDVYVKYPALGALITGLLLSVLTNWGLTRYYWIIVKEVLTLGTIGFGIFYMNQWLDQVTAATSNGDFDTLQLSDIKHLLIGNLANLIALATMVILSYVKPWGRRKNAKKNRKK